MPFYSALKRKPSATISCMSNKISHTHLNEAPIAIQFSVECGSCQEARKGYNYVESKAFQTGIIVVQVECTWKMLFVRSQKVKTVQSLKRKRKRKSKELCKPSHGVYTLYWGHTGLWLLLGGGSRAMGRRQTDVQKNPFII